MKDGPLRNGLTLEKAAETVWAVSSAEVFTLLTAERGWSEAEYKRWLAEALRRLLLPWDWNSYILGSCAGHGKMTAHERTGVRERRLLE